MIRWAQKTGPHTAALVTRILEERPHPEQGYRPCLGILRLGERYSPQRLEAACHRALAIGGVSYRSIKSILEHGLDRIPLGWAAAPEDIAFAVLYLASDEASFVTGSELVIDGGFTAQ